MRSGYNVLRQNFLGPGCGASGAAPFDRQIMPDGSEVAFQIPAGQVLVATEITVFIAGSSSISSFVTCDSAHSEPTSLLSPTATIAATTQSHRSRQGGADGVAS